MYNNEVRIDLVLHNNNNFMPFIWLSIPISLFFNQMQEFDYVFDIELDEGGPTMRKLKLPYNRDSKMPTWILYCVYLIDDILFLSLI